MDEKKYSNRPRSLFWLLLPFLIGIIGSLILHYKLKKDKVKFKDINTVNWIVGGIGTFSGVVIGILVS